MVTLDCPDERSSLRQHRRVNQFNQVTYGETRNLRRLTRGHKRSGEGQRKVTKWQPRLSESFAVLETSSHSCLQVSWLVCHWREFKDPRDLDKQKPQSIDCYCPCCQVPFRWPSPWLPALHETKQTCFRDGLISVADWPERALVPLPLCLRAICQTEQGKQRSRFSQNNCKVYL